MVKKHEKMFKLTIHQNMVTYQNTAPKRHAHTHVGGYFKELAYAIVGAGKSEICRAVWQFR